MSLIYNPETRDVIERISDALPHALLLEGKSGVGLQKIASSIAWRNLAGLVQPTDADGNIDSSAKGVIRVPQIRELVAKTRGKFTSRQVFIIDEADNMNIQAQNAFLKLLEEPAPNIHFILTSHNSMQLLPTIRSRVQRVVVKPISVSDSRSFIKKLGFSDARKTQQLLFLASGLPAELARLAKDEVYFNAQAAMIADAKEFIQGKPYQQALVVAKYYSDRSKTLQLLTLAETIISHGLATNPSTSLVELAAALEKTYERILANGNTRLQLMNFVVH